MVDAAAVDGIAAAWFAAHRGQPGLADGIVADGELVHSGGLGERRAGGPAPDADTVFRIASMTNSFTAALVLALRDSGELALDDPATRYVPELAGVRPPAPDCPPIKIRHLLTMTAGFPTDDPWGDRQQGLDPAEFARLLAPLGLDRTGYEASDVNPAQLAGGYRHHDGGWLELQPDPYGAFAPTGGVFSNVRDLASWVAGFATAFPARDAAAASRHPGWR